jgi:hypothetical protein
MDKIEAVRVAVAELGDVPVEELGRFVRARFGLELQPAIIRVIKATIRDKELLEQARAARQAEPAPDATQRHEATC